MIVSEILEHFISRSPWVNPEKTVDRIITGSPNADFDRCLVTWMPSYRALKYALSKDIKLIICHEPTFWNHLDDIPDNPAGREKSNFINAHGITIIRNHDCWDRWADIGITSAWGRFLGLPETPVQVSGDGFHHRYDVKPVTAGDFAAHAAARCAELGEAQVQLTGDPSLWISKIGIGTGCVCRIREHQHMGCDCSVVCDDGSTYWGDIQYARDAGHPVIRVNHGTSEEPGMVTLTQYINDSIDGLTAEHLVHGSMYTCVGDVTWQRDLRA